MTDLAIKDGGVVTDGEGICLGCCDYVGGSPPTDCCCFLDPTTFAWDTIRTFAQGDLCEDGGNTFESVQNGNQDHVTSDTDWWTHVSTNVSCGNVDWDAFPPYGGPGRTPAFYTATVHLIFPSTVTFSWTSNAIRTNDFWEDPFPFPPCAFLTDPGIAVNFILARDSVHGNCEPSNPEEWYVNWEKRDAGGCDSGTAAGDIGAFISAIPCLGAGVLADCPISGTLNVSHGDHAGVCIKRLVSIMPDVYEDGTGILSWRPGKILEWDNSTSYEVGDIVAWEGIFYICTADNTNQEPPNVAYWDIA